MIKIAQKKLILSNSSIKTFLKCKQHFKYKYVDKIKTGGGTPSKYMSFGNSIHLSLSDFNMITSSEYRTLAVLHNLLRKNWIRDGYVDEEEEREFGIRGLNMLTQYLSNPLDQGLKTLLMEDMVFKDMGEYVLCGKLDKIYDSGSGGIEILDYKTGQKMYGIDPIQLPIYLMLAEEKLGFYPDIVSLYYLVYNEKIIKEVDEDYISESIQYIKTLCQNILEEKTYDASPSSSCESSCEYYDICDASKSEDILALDILQAIEIGNNFKTLF